MDTAVGHSCTHDKRMKKNAKSNGSFGSNKEIYPKTSKRRETRLRNPLPPLVPKALIIMVTPLKFLK